MAYMCNSYSSLWTLMGFEKGSVTGTWITTGKSMSRQEGHHGQHDDIGKEWGNDNK